MSDSCLARPHTLCQYCRGFCNGADSLQISLQKWIECRDQIPDREFAHCPNISALRRSSLDGCHLCVLLLNSIRKGTLAEIESCTAARCRPISLKLWDPNRGEEMRVYQMKLTLQFEECNLYPASSERDLWVRREAEIPFDEASWFPDAQQSFSTGSEGCMRLARHWLAQCESNHVECCSPTTQPNALPTRLIDVEPRDDFELHLYVVRQDSSGIKYLTLSHCWGGLDVLTLKEENMNHLINGFDMKDLPKKFRDAVEVTKNLGFRYLWIDALCIIQNSASDWKREASKMATVYENSICTIGALFGVNSHAGCFQSRQPLEHFSCCILQAGSFEVFVTSKHVFWELIDEMGTGPGQPGPLNTRAWVVQERMMSPRTLYFGSRRIHWECREYTSTDHNIECDFGAEAYTSPAKDAFSILRTPWRPSAIPNHRYLFYIGWRCFLNAYTGGRLTRPEDRLVALTSIVDVVRKATGLSMLSGLWKDLLPFEILWTKDLYMDDNDLHPQPRVIRAPSWSWASHDGPVYAADITSARAPTFFVENIEVEDASEEVDDEVSTSEHCVLHISAPLVRIKNYGILQKNKNFYILSHNFQSGNVADQCFVVFDLDEPSTVGLLSSSVELCCLLVSQSSPMPGRYAHGAIRMLELIELKEMFPSSDQSPCDYEMEVMEDDEQGSSGDNRECNGNDQDEDVIENHGHQVSVSDNEMADDIAGNDGNEDTENGYEFNKLDICDHGLVLQPTEIGGRYRRVGVFRSYLHHGQKLFGNIPTIAKISIE